MGSTGDEITASTQLDVFCTHYDQAWRTYIRPGCPRSLWQFLDDEGEAFPMQLDFEDLERYMRAQHATFEKDESALGGLRLRARGESAGALATWLAGAFASGTRPRRLEPGSDVG